MRKPVGAIIGLAILLGLLFAIASYARPTSQSLSQDQSQLLIEAEHGLATVDDLEQRGILSAEVAEKERQRYVAQAQIALNEAHVQALIEVRYKLATLDDLEERGILSAKDVQAEKLNYLAEAQDIVGGTLDANQISTLLEHLDNRQFSEPQGTSRGIGDVPIPTAIWVLLSVMLVTAAAWFAQPYLIPIRKQLLARRSTEHTPISAQQAVEQATPGYQGEQGHTLKRLIIPRLSPTRHRAKLSIPPTTPFPEQIDQPPSLTESLTKRELEVLALIAEGLTNREIAQELIITPGTAKVHISNIYGKLGVNRRMQAVAKAQELGILVSEQ